MANASVTYLSTNVNPTMKETKAFMAYLRNRHQNFALSRRILCTSNADALAYLKRFGLEHDDPEQPIPLEDVAEFFGVADHYAYYLFGCRTGISSKTVPQAVSMRDGKRKTAAYSPSAILAVVPVATCGRSVPRVSTLNKIAKDIERGHYEAIDSIQDPMVHHLAPVPAPRIKKISILDGVTWSPEDGVTVSPEFADSIKDGIVNALVQAWTRGA